MAFHDDTLARTTNVEEVFPGREDDLIESFTLNTIKMNHIKTILCGHFIGIDKLERLRLLQNDPLVKEFNIWVKEPETV